MVDYLVRTGSEPVFLGMPPLNSNSVEREGAYLKRMVELELSPHVILPFDIAPSWELEEYAYQIMNLYFSRGDYIESTLLCANDRLAIGVLRAAHRHHLFGQCSESRSKRFRIAGHDDHPLSSFVYPGLTTVAQNTTAIGRSAVNQLLQHIQAPESTVAKGGLVKCFDAQLKVRESA